MGPKRLASSRVLHLLVFALILTFTFAMAGCGAGEKATPTPPATPGGSGGSGGSGGGSGGGSSVTTTTETIVTGMTIPWEMVFGPDGTMYFTENNGRIHAWTNGQLSTVYDVSAKVRTGLDGMTGLALDPAFASNHRMFVFYCTGVIPSEHCMVERLIVNNGTATSDRVIFDFPTQNRDHVGGRMKFGPDGLLYVTTGDQQNGALAQDPSAIQGKILRMDVDGNAHGAGLANPYAYAMGFRDPEGLAFDGSGALYADDHGDQSHDEVNLITAGGNYGWPTCQGACGNTAFIDPVKLWTPETAAPSGMTFYNSSVIPQWNGSLFVALLGQSDNTYAHHLHRMVVNGSTVVSEEALYKDQFGRIRNVAQGPDGFVYFSTSNGSGSDKIVRVKPQ